MALCKVIILALLIAQATSGPIVNKGKRFNLIDEIIKATEETLDYLDEPVLHTNSCVSVNLTEFYGLEEPGPRDNLTKHHLSSLRCYLTNALDLAPELSYNLSIIINSSHDLEQRLCNGKTVDQDCNIPTFDNYEGLVYVKCLLQLLGKWLEKYDSECIV